MGDHMTLSGFWALHAFPSLGAMAIATTRAKLATMFANNLLRSPAESAQLAVTMQELSRGRFEAGIGVGWSAPDCNAIGLALPDGPERARRYRERSS